MFEFGAHSLKKKSLSNLNLLKMRVWKFNTFCRIAEMQKMAFPVSDWQVQCDQMTILFVQTFAMYNNGNVPKSITYFLKLEQHFATYYINLPEMVKYFYNFAKVAKFRHIWSHCFQRLSCSYSFLSSALKLTESAILLNWVEAKCERLNWRRGGTILLDTLTVRFFCKYRISFLFSLLSHYIRKVIGNMAC